MDLSSQRHYAPLHHAGGSAQILLEDAPAVLGWEWRAMDEASSARHLAETLAALMDGGAIASQPVEPLTRLLSGAMNETALWIARSSDEATLEQAVSALDLLLRGLGSA